MRTSLQVIREWLEEGRQKGATHVIVACDTFDWEDYPVFVLPGQKAREVARGHEKVMECYSLALDIESQLREVRALHWE